MFALRQLVEANPALRQGGDAGQVSITLDIPDDLELDADRQRLQQVFLNLIKNALEAMGAQRQHRIAARLRK